MIWHGEAFHGLGLSAGNFIALGPGESASWIGDIRRRSDGIGCHFQLAMQEQRKLSKQLSPKPSLTMYTPWPPQTQKMHSSLPGTAHDGAGDILGDGGGVISSVCAIYSECAVFQYCVSTA
jgi:hypothetical protein